MKAFILAVSLTTILTTSAVAAAMRYLDQMQDSLAARTAPAVYQRQGKQAPSVSLAIYQ